MRRSEKMIVDRAEIEAVIQAGTVCHVGLVDGDVPYVVPMDFGYVDGCIYFHCAREGRKLDVIRRNPKACFEVTVDRGVVTDPDAYRCTHHFDCVMGTGIIAVVDDEAERFAGLRALMAHYGSEGSSMTDRCLGKTVVLRLSIETLTGKRNGPFA